MVKVGNSCTVSGRYSGKPAPSVTWTKNDEELKADEEVSMHSTGRHLSLNISKARREHSGRYCVNVENSAGARTGICTITVVGESPPHRNFTQLQPTPPDNVYICKDRMSVSAGIFFTFSQILIISLSVTAGGAPSQFKHGGRFILFVLFLWFLK